jgi:hypothetical protein
MLPRRGGIYLNNYDFIKVFKCWKFEIKKSKFRKKANIVPALKSLVDLSR